MEIPEVAVCESISPEGAEKSLFFEYSICKNNASVSSNE